VLDAGDTVTSLAYSPDGDTLLVGSGSALKLWELSVRDPGRSDANPTVLHGHDATVNAVAYSRDGTRFASAGQDGKALVWRSLASLLDASCASVGRNLTQEEWRQLLPGEDYQRTCDQWPYGP
jgi:WD40 repeat protein